MTNGPVSILPVLLPPILAGHVTPDTQERVEHFYFSVAAIFETWVKRRQSPHTRRAYREDVMAFATFVGIAWPRACASLLSVSIVDVQRFRESMVTAGAAPKTLNRRISSLSSFYKYLQGACSVTIIAHSTEPEYCVTSSDRLSRSMATRLSRSA
jgi:site-specific recombinase XerD